MDDLLDSLARRLGVPPLSKDETTLLLECARDVAHGSQRRNAPLAAFVLGQAVQRATGDRADALEAAVSVVRAALDPPEEASRDRPGR